MSYSMSAQWAVLGHRTNIHAVSQSSLRNACPIQGLPNEVLGEIFDCFAAVPYSGREFPAPVLLSHVCSHWRRVIINIATHWTPLRIRHTRHIDVLSDLLERSRPRPLTLLVEIVQEVLVGVQDEILFADTFRTVLAHKSRLRTLKIRGTNAVLHEVMRSFTNIPLPCLAHLDLAQSKKYPLRYLGPMMLNPDTFVSLRLERTMIECDASSLTGLRTLELIESAGTILDRTQISSLSYPDIPGIPVMANLTHLRIIATGLLLTGPIPTPSFPSDSLRFLHLSHIHIPSHRAIQSVARLYIITLGRGLEELILHDFDNASFHHFLEALKESPQPKFPVLRALTISSINLGTDLSILIDASPVVCRLIVFQAGVNLVMFRDTLRERDRWPLVTEFNFDNVNYLRDQDDRMLPL